MLGPNQPRAGLQATMRFEDGAPQTAFVRQMLEEITGVHGGHNHRRTRADHELTICSTVASSDCVMPHAG